MFRWKHTEKNPHRSQGYDVYLHASFASATPASCMKWHIGSVWTDKGSVKAFFAAIMLNRCVKGAST